MNRLMVAAALLGSTALAGCGSAVVASLDQNAQPQTARVGAHVVSGTVSNGTVETVSDRTSSGVDANAILYLAKVPFTDLEVPTSAEVQFPNGRTDGGTVIPSTGRMQAPSSLADKAIAGGDLSEDLANLRYSDDDSFLQLVQTGNGYGAARYEARSGNNAFLGYVVSGQRSDPAAVGAQTGMATFNGKAQATWFASGSGKGTAQGDSQMIATFAPGGGVVSGGVTNIAVDGVAQPGLAMTLNPSAISGNAYTGSANLVGAASSSGNYQGGFYNADVSETAGTFHLRASGVATSAGIQDVEAVGTFGASK